MQQQLLYEAAVAEIDALRELNHEKILKEYGVALDEWAEEARASGQFDAATAAAKEQQRLGSEKGLALRAAGGAPGWLVRRQQPYRAKLLRLEHLAHQKYVELSKGYITRLESMQAELVRKNDLATAGRVHAEIGQIKNQVAERIPGRRTPEASLPDNRSNDGFIPGATGKGWVFGALRSELVMYLRFDQSPESDFPDVSGQHHPGGRTHVEWTPDGYLGGAAKFRGEIGDFIWIRNMTVPSKPVMYSGPKLADGLSASAYFMLETENQSHGRSIISNRENSGFNLGIDYRHRPFFNVECGRENIRAEAAQPCKPNVWYHVAGVFDEKNVCLYVNGRLVEKVGVPAGALPVESRHRLMVGAQPGPKNKPNNLFVGRIDEAAVWDRALTSDDVRKLQYGQ